MRHKRFYFFAYFCFCFSFMHAQLLYKIPGTYKNLSAQGMAVNKTKAYILNDTGICRVYELSTGELVNEFKLGSYSANNHANNASFGSEQYDGNDIPLMYVSECRSPFRCFVENIEESKSTLVQTIRVKREGIDAVAQDWVVDAKNNIIYTISGYSVDPHTKKNIGVHRINKYRLPKIEEGIEIVLTEKDMLDSFDIPFDNMMQGASIKGKYLYMPTGLHKSGGNKGSAKRSLFVINLKTKKISKIIDLANIIDNEPEDCDFYKKKLILFCGQSGGLYVVKK